MTRFFPRRAIVRHGLAALAVAAVALAPRVGHAAAKEVHIDNFAFTPAELVVKPGTEVVWTNRDDIPHTVTDAKDPKRMKSDPLDTGDSFRFTFTKPGTYAYFCSLHPHMQGRVVVR